MLNRIIISTLILLFTLHATAGKNDFMDSIPSNFSPPAPEDNYDVQLMEQINESGWYNLHIAEENGNPDFAYSLGHFENNNHPEIIVVGLPAQTAQKLLNLAVIKILGAKGTIEPFKKYTDFTEGLSVTFIPVDFKHYADYLGYANWYYRSLPKPYPVLQMVWPDTNGKYPWEKGYEKRFLKLQPILGKTPK